jgi:hypothetical protein
VRKVVRFVRSNLRQGFEEIDLAPYRGESSLRYRAARALGRVQLTGFRKISDAERDWNSRLVGF